MCTVSFLPAREGFHLAMKRDEALTRAEALPPGIEPLPGGAGSALYPREPGGGTWVGVNGAGLALALLNWYGHRPAGKRPAPTRSRGEVIPALLPAGNTAEAAWLLAGLDLRAMGPFRLVVIAGRERGLQEWRSGGDGAWKAVALPWERAHWFSSSVDERKANRVRAEACAREAWVSPPADARWLRELHASHYPGKGPFSVCMHRADARTVSCTELTVDARQAVMAYAPGPACESGPRHTAALPFPAAVPASSRLVNA